LTNVAYQHEEIQSEENEAISDQWSLFEAFFGNVSRLILIKNSLKGDKGRGNQIGDFSRVKIKETVKTSEKPLIF
jgi:hypothetical protein